MNVGGPDYLTASGRAIFVAHSLAGAHECSRAFSASGGFGYGGDFVVGAGGKVSLVRTL